MKKRVICILLSLCLLLGTAPVLYANAADNSERTIIASGDFDVPEAEDIKETTESETKNHKLLNPKMKFWKTKVIMLM